jgi:hypothetical protein
MAKLDGICPLQLEARAQSIWHPGGQCRRLNGVYAINEPYQGTQAHIYWCILDAFSDFSL